MCPPTADRGPAHAPWPLGGVAPRTGAPVCVHASPGSLFEGPFIWGLAGSPCQDLLVGALLWLDGPYFLLPAHPLPPPSPWVQRNPGAIRSGTLSTETTPALVHLTPAGAMLRAKQKVAPELPRAEPSAHTIERGFKANCCLYHLACFLNQLFWHLAAQVSSWIWTIRNWNFKKILFRVIPNHAVLKYKPNKTCAGSVCYKHQNADERTQGARNKRRDLLRSWNRRPVKTPLLLEVDLS